MRENVRTKQSQTVDIKLIKEKLIKKHGCTCGYCKAKFFDENFLDLDHFYPRSRYPEKVADVDNYVLSCRYCNIRKSATSPESEKGERQILHPYIDNYSDHMRMDGCGRLIPVTSAGEFTIKMFNLNRETLCQYRLSNPFEWNVEQSEKENPLKNYQTSIAYVENLLMLTKKIDDPKVKQYSLRLLYGNVITAMETYLSSTLVHLIRHNEKIKWQFVEKYDWNQENVQLRNIRKEYNELDTRILTELGELLYHNIPKIKGIYKSTLDIDIFQEEENMAKICKAVSIRHDIVHRNGQSPVSKKNGCCCEIKEDDVRGLIQLVSGLTSNINEQIKIKKYAN